MAKVKGGWLIYYDDYGKKKYGAAFTTDFKTFTDASDKVQVPEGHKHGTILKISGRQLKVLQNAAQVTPGSTNP